MSGDSQSAGVARAESLALRALAQAERPAEGLHLVRWGTNAVFRTADTVVRLADSDYDTDLLQQQVDLAIWLRSRAFPTARLLHQGVVDGQPVTVWERIAEVREPTMADLAELARRFHDVTADYDGSLPEWEPLGRLGVRMDQMEPDRVITEQALAQLREVKDHLVNQVRDVDFVLPRGPIHGDIHEGNVLVDSSGPHLIDFDRIARGPREWDLVEPLAGVVLFGQDDAEWLTFAHRYGYDLREWGPWTELLKLRAMFMFSWLLTLQRTPQVEEEVRTRLAYFLEPEAPLAPWSAI
ncbi:phosphotransferase [Nocardioides anomalus]|uniref:Phosphotransferase n=1 Tax=Nocardioides anomalus TaxID=2712223 RepID=A0A6G6WG48_9ACTN|nr:phosphotransferase [Nocardioides anomalus]QIG44321.1 phosphotransferase [Nocardioides anomalus]